LPRRPLPLWGGGNPTGERGFAESTVYRIVVLEAGMIRISQRHRAGAAQDLGQNLGTGWARRSDIPLAMVLAWIAALVITTEGLMTFQNLYG
jgi:hypothetical protein